MIIEIIFALIIFILSLVLIIRNFNLAIKVMLFFSVLLHKEVFSIYTWDLLPIRLFVVALAIFIIVKEILLAGRENIKIFLPKFFKDPFVVLLLSIWLVRGLSIIFSKNLKSSIFLFSFFTTIVTLGIYFYYKFADKYEELARLIKFYIFIAFFICLFGLVQMFLYFKYDFIIGALWNVPGHFPRVGSTFWDVNHFGVLLAGLLPMLGVFILLSKNIKTRILYSIMFVFMSAILFITSSRTSWITAGISLVSFVSVLLYKRFRLKGLSYLFGIFILALIPLIREYSIKSSPFRAYIKNNFHYRLDSFASHIMLLKGSYQIFEVYPILGGGYGSFFEHFRKTAVATEFFARDPAALNTRVPAHTIWGEAMAETGMIGFLLMIFFVVFLLAVTLFGTLKLKDKDEYLPLTAIFSTYLGIFTAGIFYSYNSEFFWFIIFFYFIFAMSLIRKYYSYNQILEFFVKSQKTAFIFVSIVSFLLIFVNLGKNHLIPWDEAIYAKIAKNITVSGNYFDMRWKPESTWYEKPPFYLWSVAGLMQLAGVNSWAARLPSAISGFILVLLVYLFCTKYFSKTTAILSSLALVMGIHFLYYSRSAMIDVMSALFIASSLFSYFYYKSVSQKKFVFISGILAGCAIMTKGAVGVFPLIVILIYEFYLFLIHKKLQISQFYGLLIYIIALLLVSAPWHIYMYYRYGQPFIDQYFLYHVVNRAVSAIEDKGRPFYWYLIVMKVSMRIWFIPLIFSFLYFIYKTFKKDVRYAFLFIWAVVMFTAFSAAKSKLVWYIIPLYPPLSIMSGHFIDLSYNFISKKAKSLTLTTIKFYIYLVFIVFSFVYLFFNRKMVYTSDLTGDAAALLMEKDKVLGTEDLIYIDRVELPLALFYTDSPFEIIEFDPAKNKLPLMEYDKKLILLTKLGRFSSHIPVYNKEPVIIDQKGDYILWYFESSLVDDHKRIEELDKQINKLKKNNAFESQRMLLEKERQDLLIKVSSFY